MNRIQETGFLTGFLFPPIFGSETRFLGAGLKDLYYVLGGLGGLPKRGLAAIALNPRLMPLAIALQSSLR
uniref:Uncharacterized protein n=1 Tax=Desertifilum tharense IPPAS B-1220 TaxID=1781255 RepID=A0A1E5QM98_9CYAN|nr:hypothetical protein BH720_09515 [Desertifilum tharense IPPAS B-1220]